MATNEEKEKRRFEKRFSALLAVCFIPLIVILVLYLIADIAKLPILKDVTDYIMLGYAVLLGLAAILDKIAEKRGSNEGILGRKYFKRDELLNSYYSHSIDDHWGRMSYSPVAKVIDDGLSFTVRLHYGESFVGGGGHTQPLRSFDVSAEGENAALIRQQPCTAEGLIADEDLDEAVKKLNRRLGEIYWEYLRKIDEEAAESKELEALSRKNGKYLAKGEKRKTE